MSSNTLSFGRSLRHLFFIPDHFTQVDHASFGLYPQPVATALEENHLRVNTFPAKWFRHDYKVEMIKVRKIIANLIKASPDDVVMVQNIHSGMNAVFRSMKFQVGDRILRFSTDFSGMQSLIRFIVDTHNHTISTLIFNLTYPITNAQLVEKFEEFLDANYDPLRPIRVALVCHISTRPSTLLPIEKLVRILKHRNITVAVDGAHALGQVPLDMSTLRPDYYVSDCHKWLYTARPCAILYVDKTHQSFIHPAHISFYYRSPAAFENEFYWTGTVDYGPYMTVPAALEFRKKLGGERKIMEHNHDLVLQGAALFAKLMDTEVLQSPEQVANMCDVRLPVPNLNHPKLQQSPEEWWDLIQFEKYRECYSSVYRHNGSWYARVTAQVYNELSDYEVIANHFLTICQNELSI